MLFHKLIIFVLLCLGVSSFGGNEDWPFRDFNANKELREVPDQEKEGDGVPLYPNWKISDRANTDENREDIRFVSGEAIVNFIKKQNNGRPCAGIKLGETQKTIRRGRNYTDFFGDSFCLVSLSELSGKTEKEQLASLRKGFKAASLQLRTPGTFAKRKTKKGKYIGYPYLLHFERIGQKVDQNKAVEKGSFLTYLGVKAPIKFKIKYLDTAFDSYVVMRNMVENLIEPTNNDSRFTLSFHQVDVPRNYVVPGRIVDPEKGPIDPRIPRYFRDLSTIDMIGFWNVSLFEVDEQSYGLVRYWTLGRFPSIPRVFQPLIAEQAERVQIETTEAMKRINFPLKK